MRRLGGEVGQRASGITADAGASGLVDRPSRRAPESSEGRDARRADLVAWPAGLDVAGRGLARGQTLRKSMWVMVSSGREDGYMVNPCVSPYPQGGHPMYPSHAQYRTLLTAKLQGWLHRQARRLPEPWREAA